MELAFDFDLLEFLVLSPKQLSQRTELMFFGVGVNETINTETSWQLKNLVTEYFRRTLIVEVAIEQLYIISETIY